MDDLETRYRGVVQRFQAAAGSRAKETTLIAVSKSHPAEAIECLYALGQRDFGENYAQELVEKATALAAKGLSGIRWHFIGHLQSNKAKLVVPHLHAVHSVDSVRLAEELAKRWKSAGRPGSLAVFLEVNVDQEPTKSGVDPEDAPAISRQIASIDGLALQGLMAIPAPGRGERPFQRLRELETQCRPTTRGALSMGMTDDFELAIRNGATHVRVGTAIFGPRAPRGE